jgi:hypothetical protein
MCIETTYKDNHRIPSLRHPHRHLLRLKANILLRHPDIRGNDDEIVEQPLQILHVPLLRPVQPAPFPVAGM